MEETKHYLEDINKAMHNDPKLYVAQCERRYENLLRQAVREIVAKPEKNKIIMLAGPSSSGKTTGANKIARNISRMGYNAYVVSLDDFYKDRDAIPVDADGKQDFETVYALNLDLVADCLKGLSENGRAFLPHFDFETGKRTDNVIDLRLEAGDVVVVEGLHALNPVITDSLTTDSLTKMYVSVASDIYFGEESEHYGEMFLERKEIRFLRRTIRDYLFRSSSVANTYSMWPKVLEGEVKYLDPFRYESDYILDSIHPYEICVYKDIVLELLSELPKDNENFAHAVLLGERLSAIESVNKSIVPKTSLLREFIGK